MSARERILASVRAALADVPDDEQHVVPAPPRVAPSDRAVLLDRFHERVADYRAVVRRCSSDELVSVVAAMLSGLEAARIVVPDGLDAVVPGLVEVLRKAGFALAADSTSAPLSATDLDEMDAVITTARVGVAETGTLVLDHGAGQGRRAVTLVPDVHLCVVREDQVVADVPDAVAALDPSRPTTWISGPSATSDIELSRVEGVHGPRTLHVLIVGSSPPGGPSTGGSP